AVPDDDDERRGRGDAQLPADGRAASAGEATHVDAVVDGDEAAGADATAAVVLADLVRHADGGIDPPRAEAIDRTDAPKALEVADHGDAAAGRGEHAGEVRGEAAREVHQRGTLAPEERQQLARPRCDDPDHLRGAPQDTHRQPAVDAASPTPPRRGP